MVGCFMYTKDGRQYHQKMLKNVILNQVNQVVCPAVNRHLSLSIHKI